MSEIANSLLKIDLHRAKSEPLSGSCSIMILIFLAFLSERSLVSESSLELSPISTLSRSNVGSKLLLSALSFIIDLEIDRDKSSKSYVHFYKVYPRFVIT